jgi:hypothetical protein
MGVRRGLQLMGQAWAWCTLPTSGVANLSPRISAGHKNRPIHWADLETLTRMPKHLLTYTAVVQLATSNTRASHDIFSDVHAALQWMHSAVQSPGGSIASSSPQQCTRIPGPLPSRS